MDFGFIQAAAPAPPAVPLTDAPSSPDPFGGDAAAFDAALAQTLAGESAAGKNTVGQTPGKSHAPSNTGVVQPSHWLLTTLFTDSASGSVPSSDAAVAGEPDAAEGEEAAPTAADITGAETAAESMAMGALPLDQPWRVPSGVVGGDAASNDDGTADGETTAVAEAQADSTATAESAPALGSSRSPGVHVAVSGSGSLHHGAARAAAASSAPAVPAEAAPELQGAAFVAQAGQLDGIATGDPTAVREPRIAPAGDGVGVSAMGAAAPGGAAPTSQAPAVVATAQVDAQVQDAALRIAETAAAVVATPAGTPAVAAPSANAGAADAVRQQSPESSIVPGVATAAQFGGQDASTTGHDQANGHGRPSSGFMRFAAALAQVTPPADEDAGRAPVAPVAISSAPASAAAPAGTAGVATAAPASETPGPENVGRLVQAMRVMARPGAWEANVRLNPEHLGEVSIAVRVERNAVSAVVNAESAGVRQWLESQEQAMRNGMAEHGLQLDRFLVQRDGQRRESPEQEQPQGRRQPRRGQAATTERFEIVV